MLNTQSKKQRFKKYYYSTIGWVSGLFNDPYESVRGVIDCIQSSKFEDAIIVADEILETDSSNTHAHYFKGYCYSCIAETIHPPELRKSYYQEMLNLVP